MFWKITGLLRQRAMALSRSLSWIDLETSSFDFFVIIDGTTVDARASFPCLAPCVRVGQVHRPERPGSALNGADRVNQAVSPSLVIVRQEDAILVIRSLDEAESVAHFADVSAAHLLFGNTEVLSDPDNILLRDPHETLCRTGTAISTLQALERQSVDVPRIVLVHLTHRNNKFINDTAG